MQPTGAASEARLDPRLFLVLGSVIVIGPAAMDIYLPGFPELAREFDASQSAAQVTITTFLIGLAVGQLLAGPLSDVYGRRRPLIGGMALFALASLVCAVAPSLHTLSALRLVQGALAAAGMAIGRAIVRDLYSGAAAARYLSWLMLLIGLGPIVAPIVGGEILRFTTWRGPFVAVAALGLLVTIMAVVMLPETLPAHRRRPAGLASTLRTFAALLRDRRFVGFVLVCGFSSAAVVGYVAGSAFVLQDVYGMSPQAYGLVFGVTAVALVAGAQVNAYLLARFSPRRLLAFGLATLVAGGVALLLVVSLGAGSAATVVPAFVLVMLSWSFILSNTTALALTDHPDVAGTAAALLGVSQFTFSAAVAPLAGIGGDDSAVPLALVIALCGIGAALSFAMLLRGPRGGPTAATSEP